MDENNKIRVDISCYSGSSFSSMLLFDTDIFTLAGEEDVYHVYDDMSVDLQADEGYAVFSCYKKGAKSLTVWLTVTDQKAFKQSDLVLLALGTWIKNAASFDNIQFVTKSAAVAKDNTSEDANYPQGVLAMGNYGENAAWVLDNDGTLTISGTGEISTPDGIFDIPWITKVNHIKSIKIKDGITRVSDIAYLPNLTNITFAESVEYFNNLIHCQSLESITVLNPDCEIDIPEEFPLNKIVVYGYTNSTAQAFAYLYNYSFVSLDSESGDNETGDIVASGICGPKASWTLDKDGVLTVSGNGEMADYAWHTSPWYEHCSSIRSVVIENGITSIGNYAFLDCTALTAVSIPDSVNAIGRYAFYECTSLTEVMVPDSVEEIKSYAFKDCSSLSSITIMNPFCILDNYSDVMPAAAVIYGYNNSTAQTYAEKFNRTFVSLGDAAYRIVDSGSCGDNLTWSLDTKSQLTISGEGEMTSVPWSDYCSYIRSIVIETGATNIADYAFADCDAASIITIPESVKSIGRVAFNGCDLLAEITLPSNLTVIDDYTFNGCWSLESIVIPDSVTTIEEYAFSSCYALKSAVLPERLNSISDSMFESCTKLENINIPETVLHIGEKAFYCCKSLQAITIPDSVKTISSYAFFCCESLTSVTVPENVESIEDAAFGGCDQLKTITILNPDCIIGDDEYTINDETVIYCYANSTAQVYAEKYNRTFVILKGDTDFLESEDAVITTDGNICAKVGKTAESLFSQARTGATLVDKNGNALSAEQQVGTGAVLTLADGTEYEIIVPGDVDGDGNISASDARLALRASVGLETYDETSVQYKAAKVKSADTISASDARLILRASVGLDDPNEWFDKIA